jgi:uncharacterized protein YcbK (DUF882 family)
MKYFKERELMCKCGCGQVEVTDALKTRLDALREAFGKPIIVTSGYRCSNHPLERIKPKAGYHNKGIAVDIAVDNLEDLASLIHHAEKLGFRGIGISRSFLHLDLRDYKTWWSY